MNHDGIDIIERVKSFKLDSQIDGLRQRLLIDGMWSHQQGDVQPLRGVPEHVLFHMEPLESRNSAIEWGLRTAQLL